MLPSSFSSQAADRLQTTMALGMSSNLFTAVGMAAAWVFLAKTGWVSGFWNQLGLVFCLAPVFMSDALNCYVLGRIKIEKLRGWDDIQITVAGRDFLARWHVVFRAFSLLASLLLAAAFLTTRGIDANLTKSLLSGFLVVLALHSIRCFHTMRVYFSPRVRSLSAQHLLKRGVLSFGVVLLWAGYLYSRPFAPMGWFAILAHGTLYFLFISSLHPLPSKYSVFRPGLVPKKPLSTEVKEISDDSDTLAASVFEEADQWQSRLDFTKLGSIELPLLELPLFRASGLALLAPDQKSLLLILQSEVRSRIHRSCLSWTETEKIIITTDFGSPDARVPSQFIYDTHPFEDSSETFWHHHREKLSGTEIQVTQPPWTSLEQLIKTMLVFLETDVGAAGEIAANLSLEGKPSE